MVGNWEDENLPNSKGIVDYFDLGLGCGISIEVSEIGSAMGEVND